MENAHEFVKDESLKKLLKDNAGIGTPATQAGIIDTLVKRGYVEIKGKNLVITLEGKKLIEAMETEQVCDPAYEREFSILMNRDLMLFYVRSVTLRDGAVKINLSRKSIHIPELLIKEALQRYGYNLNDYRFKCIRRIAGKRSLVVSIGFLPEEIHKDINAQLGKEALRIFAYIQRGEKCYREYSELSE